MPTDVNATMEHILYKYGHCKQIAYDFCHTHDGDDKWAVAEMWDLVISIAEDAENMARAMGYHGKSIFDEE